MNVPNSRAYVSVTLKTLYLVIYNVILGNHGKSIVRGIFTFSAFGFCLLSCFNPLFTIFFLVLLQGEYDNPKINAIVVMKGSIEGKSNIVISFCWTVHYFLPDTSWEHSKSIMGINTNVLEPWGLFWKVNGGCSWCTLTRGWISLVHRLIKAP